MPNLPSDETPSAPVPEDDDVAFVQIPAAPAAQSAAGIAAGQQTQASSSRRQAFRDLRRELSNEDLASPGVQKMLLEAMERAESECENLQGYVGRYHERDKQAAVLEERQHAATAIEILFGVGVGVGGAIVGVAPLYWDKQPQGIITLGLGLALMIGATVARVIKR